MGWLLGTDEAGYGPNLGPLVVTVTAWEVDTPPAQADLWTLLNRVVTRDAGCEDGRVLMGDSKAVYSPAQGLARLETSVLAALAAAGLRPRSFCELLAALGVPALAEPWFLNADVRLPVAGCEPAGDAADRWAQCTGVRLKQVRTDVVLTERFNLLTRTSDSKGQTLSEVTLELIRSVWPPEEGEAILVQCDKHGGRNRYQMLLPVVVGETFIQGLGESMAASRYRAGSAEFRFETKSERHLPVALASMVSKYVRELSMLLFNQFWARHVPDLKPTAGYPGDARRFRDQIAAQQQQLQIPDDVLWRHR